MSTPPSPPRLAERLVALTVRDEEWRASVLGDLSEEFQTMREQSGPARARRWYWRTAVAVGGRTLRSALRRPTRMAWTTAVADDRPRAGWRAGLGREVTHATRSLWRQPGLALVVLTTLALALAANSTILAVLDALVLRPYRFADVDRMVVAASSDPQQGLFDRESVAAADFRDWRDGAPSLAHLSAAEWWDANLSGVDEPEQVAGFRVSADFFETFAIQPIVGRAFLDSESTPGQHRRVVLSHALWTRRFAADPGVVGRTIRFDGEPYEVVGIAPAGFTIPLGAQVWSPIAYSDQQWTDRRGSFLTVFGRLAARADDRRGPR